VVHSYPNEQERVYEPLLGAQSALTGASLQNAWNATHERTHHWVNTSARAGKPWVVANDEQGSASFGVPPDPGYEGFSGIAGTGKDAYDLDDVRRYTLWGNLMAGGAGVEYYFGYKLAQNDLVAEDFRSRDRSWDFCRVAQRLDLSHVIAVMVREHDAPHFVEAVAEFVEGSLERPTRVRPHHAGVHERQRIPFDHVDLDGPDFPRCRKHDLVEARKLGHRHAPKDRGRRRHGRAV
jgi:hypothetical protein